ncbi:AbiTii domain-containing protein [Arthrobacter oryzae]|uniref:AbiTii domain-containing protein n=1 Tax=Arthrobacter oryzae TaxID=409290 RepID=UPI003594530A
MPFSAPVICDGPVLRHTRAVNVSALWPRENKPITRLTKIIDAASDGAFTTSNLLRKVQTVAFRLEAEELGKWAQRELFGYKGSDPVPVYRGPISTPVTGVWA